MQTGKLDYLHAEAIALREIARLKRSDGSTEAVLPAHKGAPPSLVFSIGAPGMDVAAVRVVIRDEAGIAVATMTLAGFSGPQNIIWTPRPGTPPGAYAAYWKGEG